MINESIYRQLLDHAQITPDPDLLKFIAKNANGHSILYMSLEQFCAFANVDEEQALSFFKIFGANSFLAFKRLLREFLYYEANESGIVPRSVSSIADEIIRYELQNLAEFSSNLDTFQMRQLAADILSASEVVLLCHDSASPAAQNLVRMFRVLGIKHCMATTDNVGDTAYLSTLTKTAMVISFGVPRYSKPTLMRLKLLKQQGVRLVSITDSPESPFAHLADYYFCIPLRSFDFTDSFSAMMTFVSVLSVTIALLNRDETFARLHAREARLDDMNMYF